MAVWVNAAVPLVAAAAVVLLALRRPSDRALDGWAARFGVVLSDPRLRKVARGHLRVERSGRSIGAAAGILAAGSPLLLGPIAPDLADEAVSSVWSVMWIVCAALGALGGVAIIQLLSRPTGVASLVERTPGRYVDGRLFTWMRAMSVGAVAATAIAVLAGAGNPVLLVAGAAACVLAEAALVLGVRSITDRPMIGADGLEPVVDGALRASDSHQLAGVSVALSIGGVALCLHAVLDEALPGLSWVAFLLAWQGVFMWWSISRASTWLGLFHWAAR